MSLSVEEKWARLESWLGRPVVIAISIFLSVCTGIGLAAKHLSEAVWQDEAATLLFHVSRGVIDPFLHYVSPNSHVAFTSLMAAWLKLFPGGVDLLVLRALPLLLFGAAIPVTFAAARRLGGYACAHAAALLFASSAVSENFATQLRGYGPSWVFMAGALLCAIGVRARRVWIWPYFGSCVGAVAMLPTNVYLLGVIGVSAAAMLLADPPSESKRERAFALVVMPALALLVAYGAIWRELLSYAGVDFSEWTHAGLLWEWLRGANSNLWPLIPLAGAGIALVISSMFAQGRVPPWAVGALALLMGFVVLVSVIPNPPFPRTFVPYLPIWISSVCALAATAARSGARLLTAIGIAGGLVACLMLAVFPYAATCRGAPSNGYKYQYDLCHQYFRDDYRPAAVLDIWAAESLRRPIVSDFEGYFALSILRPRARIYEYRNVREPLPARPLIVAHDATDLRTMANRLRLEPGAYRLAADTGYFKVYTPGPLP